MPLNPNIVPTGSCIWGWLNYLRITEVPVSYQITTALSLIGMVLTRNVWVDQVEWKVYPNLSVLLVGPSGIGKDVAIRAINKVVADIDPELEVGGKTMEAIVEQLLQKGELAAAYLPAPELTAFIGGKDYQKSMVQELTDLLTTGETVNVSLKSCPGIKRVIRRPTITMVAGSTAEWLHKAMPDGSLDGGLFPRFLIVCEEYGSKHIAFPKYSIDPETRAASREGKERFVEVLKGLKDKYNAHPQEIAPLPSAVEYYENWYANRFSYFSPVVRAYANRSRDQMLRLGMLCAISCGRSFITVEDFVFAKGIINYIAASIEHAAVPPTLEARIIRGILEVLPVTAPVLIRTLSGKYSRKDIINALQTLFASEQVVTNASKQIVLKEQQPDART